MSADAPIASAELVSDIPALAFLQASSLCKGLTPELYARLTSGGRVCTFAGGAVVVREGDRDDGLYVLFDGSVSVCKVHAGTIVEIAVLDRGQIFGEMATMTRQPRSASVVTRTEARLLYLAGDAVRSVADAEPRFGRRLAALMAGHAKDTEKKLTARA